MATYSIKDLEKLSGIKAHTIRIWEQRYGIIEPKRTQTNIRYYTDEDLTYVLNIALLNKNGWRISKIAKMSVEDINLQVSNISKQNPENKKTQIQALTIAMIEFDELKFEKIINSSIESSSFQDTMIHLVVPFLEKLSLLWLAGSISTVHEHFITALIRQKIAAHLDTLPIKPGKENPDRYLLYLPPGLQKEHELFLLLLHCLLRKQGHETLFLGADIAFSDLKIASDLYKPKFLYTFLSNKELQELSQELLAQWCAQFEQIYVLLSLPVNTANVPDNVFFMEDFSEILEHLGYS